MAEPQSQTGRGFFLNEIFWKDSHRAFRWKSTRNVEVHSTVPRRARDKRGRLVAAGDDGTHPDSKGLKTDR